ncbi:MAG: hypothetical protein OEV49_15570 [candidate division Zixibacteria bacterium]|nr:hypothetical protein [candidate division Zixibacteria bacterium]MDH3938502.1 hypothetical protein [candidate division Zixibacteria bacterium]MDH4035659.1 hypothetical protein [candidate division Zixibacteria bacterium]
MKRLITLSLALILGVAVGTTMMMPNDAEAIDAKLTGLPVSLNADGLEVFSLVVEVKKGWVNTDNIALDITIEGFNNTVSFRGRQVVPMSMTSIFPDTDERDLVHVLVEWNDAARNVHAEVYEVCVQVLAGGIPLGGNECDIFSVVQ